MKLLVPLQQRIVRDTFFTAFLLQYFLFVILNCVRQSSYINTIPPRWAIPFARKIFFSVKRASSLLLQTHDLKNRYFIKKVGTWLGEPARLVGSAHFDVNMPFHKSLRLFKIFSRYCIINKNIKWIFFSWGFSFHLVYLFSIKKEQLLLRVSIFRCAITIYRHGIHELLNELPNGLRLRKDLGLKT